MKQEVIDAFNQQIGQERDAAEVYDAIAIWCAASDHKGFAEFFRNQAAEERKHVERFVHHMLERGMTPKLGALDAPPMEYTDLANVAEAALAHERANTHGIYDALRAAQTAGDFPAINFLYEFVNEQVEEEAWANRMLVLVKRATCAGSLYSLDRHIVGDLTGKD
jgi:ferritin